jgi:hypothetical protein
VKPKESGYFFANHKGIFEKQAISHFPSVRSKGCEHASPEKKAPAVEKV